MLNVKVDPWPSLDLTEIDPPMNSDIFLHMVNPRPTPYELRSFEDLSFPNI